MDNSLQLIWQIPMLLMSILVWILFLDGFFSPFPRRGRDRKRVLELLKKKERSDALALADRSKDRLAGMAGELVQLLWCRDGSSGQALASFYAEKEQTVVRRYEWLFEDIRQSSIVVGFLGTLLGSFQVLKDLAESTGTTGLHDLFRGLSGAIISSIYGVILFLICMVISKLLERPGRRAWRNAREFLMQVEETWREQA